MWQNAPSPPDAAMVELTPAEKYICDPLSWEPAKKLSNPAAGFIAHA